MSGQAGFHPEHNLVSDGIDGGARIFVHQHAVFIIIMEHLLVNIITVLTFVLPHPLFLLCLLLCRSVHRRRQEQ